MSRPKFLIGSSALHLVIAFQRHDLLESLTSHGKWAGRSRALPPISVYRCLVAYEAKRRKVSISF
ncbi:MAG: hypothetical protein RIS57_67 [Actinomycetota bacterium]